MKRPDRHPRKPAPEVVADDVPDVEFNLSQRSRQNQKDRKPEQRDRQLERRQGLNDSPDIVTK